MCCFWDGKRQSVTTFLGRKVTQTPLFGEAASPESGESKEIIPTKTKSQKPCACGQSLAASCVQAGKTGTPGRRAQGFNAEEQNGIGKETKAQGRGMEGK